MSWARSRSSRGSMTSPPSCRSPPSQAWPRSSPPAASTAAASRPASAPSPPTFGSRSDASSSPTAAALSTTSCFLLRSECCCRSSASCCSRPSRPSRRISDEKTAAGRRPGRVRARVADRAAHRAVHGRDSRLGRGGVRRACGNRRRRESGGDRGRHGAGRFRGHAAHVVREPCRRRAAVVVPGRKSVAASGLGLRHRPWAVHRGRHRGIRPGPRPARAWLRAPAARPCRPREGEVHPVRGQALVELALCAPVILVLALPIVLLPAAAFAVDAASAAAVHARLEQATWSAAESAVQQIDADALRAGGGLTLDQRSVESVARDALAAEDPNATIERLAVDGLYVTVEAAERLQLPLSFLGAPAVKLRAKAMARLTLGYESPSSFLPFSVSTL